ncbi:MAG: amino acid ABC transporter permease [Rhodobacteraceae bacterium]|nr:amino acid ABC transporter permease [Paracoccaceae bacterium]
MIEIFLNNWRYLLLGAFPNGPLGGLAMTLALAISAIALTFPLAVLLALGRTMGASWLRVAIVTYVTVIRGIPLLMLLLWIYFFLPLVLGFPLSPFLTVLIAIVLFQVAYLSEVIRGGLDSLPKGQFEAAAALGMSRSVMLIKVILPQVLLNVLPGIMNLFTSVVKETSLAYVIALAELTYSASQINATLMVKPMQVYMMLALIYFALCWSVSAAAGWMDRRIATRRSQEPAT